MRLYVLETTAPAFFQKSFELENADSEGSWKYFDFIDSDKVLGLFQSSKALSLSESSITPHSSFFDFLLGQFSPKVEDRFNLVKTTSFYDFCNRLNNLLNENIKIYDLSVKKQWIWHEGNDIKVSPKLKDYLNFN